LTCVVGFTFGVKTGGEYDGAFGNSIPLFDNFSYVSLNDVNCVS
jgi:hypothetical protein